MSQACSTAAILTCHSRKDTGVTNNVNDGSALLNCPSELYQCDREHAQYQNTETEQSNLYKQF